MQQTHLLQHHPVGRVEGERAPQAVGGLLLWRTRPSPSNGARRAARIEIDRAAECRSASSAFFARLRDAHRGVGSGQLRFCATARCALCSIRLIHCGSGATWLRKLAPSVSAA